MSSLVLHAGQLRAGGIDQPYAGGRPQSKPANSTVGRATTTPMERTRRYWSAVGLGGLLAVGAVVLARPALLGGAVVLWGWLLAHQYRFLRAFEAALDDLSLSLASTRSRVVTETATVVSMHAELEHTPAVELTAVARLPVSAANVQSNQRTLTLDETGATETAFTVEWPIAGAFEIGPPVVTGSDRYGLFRHRVERQASTTVTVDPRHARDVHVGQGSHEIAGAYGDHEGGRHGGGLEAAELRKYVPGDNTRRIDWKATARLNELHVREQEPTTNRVVALLVDHRSGLEGGPAGETKLDYLRHVALAFVDTAQEFNDTIGLYGIGDEGITTQLTPRAGQGAYEELRTALWALAPTASPSDRDDADTRPTVTTSGVMPSPEQARRVADRLRDEDSSFGRTLTPFFEDATSYVRRIDDDPLFQTVRRRVLQRSEATWTVIFTDDTRRTELREALKVARKGDNLVMVFLTPSVVFESEGITDPEAAYDRYVEFEQFRRSLARMDRVTAFEVAPGGKLDAVLAGNSRSGRTRWNTNRTAASDTESDDTGTTHPTE